MIEEKIIPQNTDLQPSAPKAPSLSSTEDTVNTSTEIQAPNLDQIKAEFEQKIAALQEKNSKDKEIWKSKINEIYEKQDAKKQKQLQDQGQWKTLWEEANQTNQKKDQTITDLQKQLEELRSSNELSNTKNSALSVISSSGAINADQTLSLLQNQLKRNESGDVVILNGGVEQDLKTYLNNIKQPGSGWEHHFKPSSAAGMGAKPNTNNNASIGGVNPWKTGNLTQQLIMENENPTLASVMKREAQKS